MLNFKCVLKCLTEVLTYKLEAYSFSKQNKKKKTSPKHLQTCTLVILLGYYYFKILLFKLHNALQTSALLHTMLCSVFVQF